MATNYISTHGMIWGEVNSAGEMRSYGHDALGSVTETFTGTGALENTYRYKPYGTTLAKTGTAVDPSFLWNGGNGYRATGLASSNSAVRRRHYSTSSCQWTTGDPTWPRQMPYVYVGGSPASFIDPSGLDGGLTPVASCHCCPRAFAMTSEHCFGQGSGQKPVCPGSLLSTDRGFIMTLSFGFDLDYPTLAAPSAPCGMMLSYEIWRTEGGSRSGPFGPDELTSSGMIALLSCAGKAQGLMCGVGLFCQAQYTFLGSGDQKSTNGAYPFGFEIDVTGNFFTANPSTCPTLYASWTGVLLWDQDGPPTTWTP